MSITTAFTGVKDVDFILIQSDPPIIKTKTSLFSVNILKDNVLVRRLKFKIGIIIKGKTAQITNDNLTVSLSWEPDGLISSEDFEDGSEFNFQFQ